MDLVEVSEGTVTPVDYKHGRPRDGVDGLELWPADRVQLAIQGLVLRKPAVRMIHNVAIFALTSFAAGYAFLAAGGRVGELKLPGDIPALLLCGGVYFLCNSALVSIVIGLTQGPNPWRVWQRNFLQGILHHLSFITLGALVAVVYLRAGPWGLVLVALPLLVARHSFGLYMEIRADLKDFVRALSEVLEEVDPYTRHHSVRVSQYSVRLARGLRLAERHVEEIEYAALVHDLGKIGPHHQHILPRSCRACGHCGARPRSCAPITSAPTDRATRSGSRRRTSRSARASSTSPTPSTP